MSKRARGPLDPSEVAKSPLAEAVLADVMARFAQHEQEATLPRGPRGSFYDLRPYGMGHGVTYRKKMKDEPATDFGPSEAHAKYVEDLLGRARRAGLIPELWVADGRAPGPFVPVAYDDAEEFGDNVVMWAENFKLDAQRFQPIYVEVLCEAADLRPRLSRVAGNEYGVAVYAGGGMGGIKGKREMGERARRRSKPSIVFQIGDRDDKGEDIYLNAAEDSIGWLEKRLVGGKVKPTGKHGRIYSPDASLEDLDVESLPDLTFFRLAFSSEQAEDLDLLDEDGKAEADAIPVPILDGWLREAIEAVQDSPCRAEYEEEQRRQREQAPEAIRAALAMANGGA